MAQSYIMIVDDNPANLKLLEDMLSLQGHEVRSFPLGRLALLAAARNPPDLILLDINMPEMNGYEVCERLKTDRGLAEIPVIFLSAMNDVEDKVKAFRAGAVDYISKPFHFEEVHARVQTQLNLHTFQQSLKSQNERLEEAVAARTRELAEANRRLTILDRSKNDFLGLISHEFRTPLNGLIGVGELILEGMAESEDAAELKELFGQSRRRILAIIDDALLLTQIDLDAVRLQSSRVSWDTALRRAVAITEQLARNRGVVFSAVPSGLGFLLAEEDLIVRALQALLETAVKFCATGETVHFVSEVMPPPARLIVECRGKNIPDPVLEKFFDLFSISEASTPAGDLGLGPALASRILSLFGASVGIANCVPPGIRITIA